MTAAIASAMAETITIQDIASALAGADEYASGARYEVLLPSMAEPIVYDLELNSSTSVVPDSLSPCDYMITWHLRDREGGDGFASYFGGHLYRYRDHRLAEYHADRSPVSFAPRGDISRGVQSTTQFVELLPAHLATLIGIMADDSTYTYTLTERPDGWHLKGVQRVGGYDGRLFTYVFDRHSLMPLRSEVNNNPDQISEQVVTVTYIPTDKEVTVPMTEPELMALFPDVFSTYREGTYTLTELPGRALPQLSAQTVMGDRYIRHRGPDEHGLPAVLVFLDPAVDSATDTVRDVRAALATLPRATRVLWVLAGRSADTRTLGLDSTGPDETVLVNTDDIARRCGVTASPAMIFVDGKGIVRDVQSGLNNDMRGIVIQKTTNTY